MKLLKNTEGGFKRCRRSAWALRQRPWRSPRQGRTYHGRRGRQRRGRMEWHLRL